MSHDRHSGRFARGSACAFDSACTAETGRKESATTIVPASPCCARPFDSGGRPLQHSATNTRGRAYELALAAGKAKKLPRVVCGARRHRDGQPCEALSLPGRKRCRFHGGMTTGPRTPEGIAKVTLNLPWNRKRREVE
jgi:hypothetical protein